MIADVVPLEVTLSCYNLTMKFPDESLEPSVDASVTMENPGEARRPGRLVPY